MKSNQPNSDYNVLMLLMALSLILALASFQVQTNAATTKSLILVVLDYPTLNATSWVPVR